MNDVYRIIMMIAAGVFGAGIGYNFSKMEKIADVIENCELSEKELFCARRNKRKRICYMIGLLLADIATLVFIGGLIK